MSCLPVSYEYDYNMNVIKETNAVGDSVTSTYNALGQLVSSTDYLGTTTNYEYDGVGNLFRTTSPVDNNTTAETLQCYNAEGLLAREKIKTDTNAYRETDYTYDELGRLSAVIKDETTGDNYTKYFYDVKGNPIKVVTGLTADCTETTIPDTAAVTQYEYHPYFNSITKITKPDGTIQYFNYDLFGLLTEQGYTKNNTNSGQIYYTYDILGQLLSKTAGNKTESFTYDKLGNVTQTVDESGTTYYTYDTLGRLKSEIRDDGVEKWYNYDSNSNRTTFGLYTDTYYLQQSLSYDYDALNRVTSIADNGMNVSSYTYNKNSQLLTENNIVVQSSYTYNIGGMVTNKTTTSGGTVIQSDNYSYYPDINVKTENGKTYTYDAQNRLSNVAEGTNNTSYTFDERGNRLTKTGDNMTDKVYNKNNQLTGYTYMGYGLPYNGYLSYDIRGNLNGWSVMEEEIWDIRLDCSYNYDGFNRMSGLYDSYNGISAQYEYDSSGLRKSKTIEDLTYGTTKTTDFVLDGINVVAEITEGEVAENEITNYVRGINGIIYRKSPDGTKTYYVTNNHGDVTKLVNSSGTVIQTYTYDEYGNVTSSTGNDPNPFLYCGEYYDWESGLIYLRARYYSPELGRFISEDPIRDDLNWYVYCGSNPLNFWDPSGLLYEAPLTEEAEEAIAYIDALLDDAVDRFQNGDKSANEDIHKYMRLKNDILIENANPSGSRVGFVMYDVPVFSQGEQKLCWAYCHVMYDSFRFARSYSQEDADVLAGDLSAVRNNGDRNHGGLPSNALKYTGSINLFELYSCVKQGPMYAVYQNSNGRHMVLVTGVMRWGNEGYIFTNNPWGDKNVQSYEDFVNGIPNGVGYKLVELYIAIPHPIDI